MHALTHRLHSRSFNDRAYTTEAFDTHVRIMVWAYGEEIAELRLTGQSGAANADQAAWRRLCALSHA